MMKNVIFCVTCVSFGIGIGILATKNHYKKLAFHEINEVREVYRRKNAAKEAVDRNAELKKQLLKEDKTDATDTENEVSALLKRYSGERHNVFSNPPDADEIDNSWGEEDDDPYEIVVDRTGPREESSDPFEITEDEFASEKLFYDKVMVEYYTDGIAVLEDSDQIIESLEELIGPYILGLVDHEGEVYVRNDNRSTDYGIIFKGTKFVPEEDSG